MSLSTNLVGATPVVIRNGAVLVASIKITQFVFDAPVLYLQLFNSASPTVGTTAPVAVIEVPVGSTQVPIWVKIAYSGKYGGRRFATAFSMAVTTTHDGAVAPDAGDEPQVIVDWEPQG